jgi:signal transduction histidine kinase
MVAVGFGWLVYQLSWLPGPAWFLQYPANQLELPFLVWLALAYPTGRLRSRAEVGLVAFTWFVWSWGQAAAVLTTNIAPCDVPTCAAGVQLLHLSPDQAGSISSFSNWGALEIDVATVTFVVLHWVQATKRARRSIAPLVWMVAPPAVWAAVFSLGNLSLVPVSAAIYPWFNLALTTVPLGYAYSQVRGRLDRARVGDLLRDLGDGGGGGALTHALARTLHDPSLEVVYWLPEEKRFADLSGRYVDLPAPADPSRAATILDRGGEPLAAVIHDTAVADDPELMSAATSAVRMAIDNSRLQALVRAQLDEVRASRARIVAAHDEERRRLERDLHDGAQQRLVTLSLLLGEARRHLQDDSDPSMRKALDSASSQVGEALVEVRELARGIHPAVLTRAGLVPAIRSVAERSAVPISIDAADVGRLAPVVEAAAYFVVTEAVVNAAKHAHASLVRVIVTREGTGLRVEVADDGVGGADESAGTGLRGLADRVRAVDGSFSVTSSPGEGTRVVAEIPCG